jgi:hypothetical protein
VNTVLEYLKYNRAPVRQSDFLELAQWRIPLASVRRSPFKGTDHWRKELAAPVHSKNGLQPRKTA